MKFNKLANLFKGDKIIWMVFFFLALVSLIEVFSASAGLTYKSGSYTAPIFKHAGLLFGGFCASILMLNVPPQRLRGITVFVYMLVFALLFASLVIGESTNGASRWISIGWLQFQPSELMKGVLVWLTAQVLSVAQTEKGAHGRAIIYIAIFVIPPSILIFKENFSTGALIFITIYVMMFLARVPLKQLGITAAIASSVVVLFLAFVFFVGETKTEQPTNKILVEQTTEDSQALYKRTGFFGRADTWKSRLIKFVNSKEVPPNEVDLDKDAQVAHANIAIATSNIKGLGPGNSVERDFLSQAFSDFIYAIIIEELGIVGAAFVAFLYIVLLFRAGVIASKCPNSFLAFLIMGYALLLVFQATFNMVVAVGLGPVTGQPLPLISKGGTSTIITCIYMGIILSVSRIVKQKEDAEKKVQSQ